MERTPTAVYFRDGGTWKSEDVRTVTRPSGWTLRQVVTVTGRRFNLSDASIVVIY